MQFSEQANPLGGSSLLTMQAAGVNDPVTIDANAANFVFDYTYDCVGEGGVTALCTTQASNSCKLSAAGALLCAVNGAYIGVFRAVAKN